MIFINEPNNFPEIALGQLMELGPVYFPGEVFDAREITILFVRLNYIIDKTFISQFPNLLFIVSPTTGITHIDLEALTERGIELISLRGQVEFLQSIRATAEHTVAITLALKRKIFFAFHSVSNGYWDRYPFKGTEISNKNIFLLGYGRVAQQVAKVYLALGANVYAYDVKNDCVPKHMRMSVIEGFAKSDVISIHIPFTEQNRCFVSAQLLRSMKPNALLINTSRGEVLDQHTLFDLLETNSIGGAALDVLWNEPSPELGHVQALLNAGANNILVTPHISGFTEESLEKVENFMVSLLVSKIREPLEDE